MDDTQSATDVAEVGALSRRRQALLTELDEHAERERWSEAVAACEALASADLETPPDMRARYLETAAAIARDKLKSKDRALSLFNQVLDLTPESTKTWTDVEGLLTGNQDWPGLVKNIHRMCKR